MVNGQELGILQQLQQAQSQAQSANESVQSPSSMNNILGLLQSIGSLGANIAGIATGTGEQGRALTAGARDSMKQASENSKAAQKELDVASKQLKKATSLDIQMQADEKKFGKDPDFADMMGQRRVAWQSQDIEQAEDLGKSFNAAVKSRSLMKSQGRENRAILSGAITDVERNVVEGNMSPKQATETTLLKYVGQGKGIDSQLKLLIGLAAKAKDKGGFIRLLRTMAGWVEKSEGQKPPTPEQAAAALKKRLGN